MPMERKFTSISGIPWSMIHAPDHDIRVKLGEPGIPQPPHTIDILPYARDAAWSEDSVTPGHCILDISLSPRNNY